MHSSFLLAFLYGLDYSGCVNYCLTAFFVISETLLVIMFTEFVNSPVLYLISRSSALMIVEISLCVPYHSLIRLLHCLALPNLK